MRLAELQACICTVWLKGPGAVRLLRTPIGGDRNAVDLRRRLRRAAPRQATSGARCPASGDVCGRVALQFADAQARQRAESVLGLVPARLAGEGDLVEPSDLGLTGDAGG